MINTHSNQPSFQPPTQHQRRMINTRFNQPSFQPPTQHQRRMIITSVIRRDGACPVRRRRCTLQNYFRATLFHATLPPCKIISERHYSMQRYPPAKLFPSNTIPCNITPCKIISEQLYSMQRYPLQNYFRATLFHATLPPATLLPATLFPMRQGATRPHRGRANIGHRKGSVGVRSRGNKTPPNHLCHVVVQPRHQAGDPIHKMEPPVQRL